MSTIHSERRNNNFSIRTGEVGAPGRHIFSQRLGRSVSEMHGIANVFLAPERIPRGVAPRPAGPWAIESSLVGERR